MEQVFAAVKGLIENDKKYLLIKQKIGDEYIYDLPGGKVDYGESPYETLHREIKEETGLEVEVSRALGMWWFFRKTDNNQVICYTFLCRAKSTKVDLTKNPISTENIAEAVWVSKEELTEKITNPTLLNLVKEL